jgi:hypothetical protein
METYTYARRKTAATNESMSGVLDEWVVELIKQAEGALPHNLKLDGIKWTPYRRGYASLEAKGYSKGDLEAKSTIAILRHSGSCSADVHMWYQDASMTGEGKADFNVGCDDTPQAIIQKINGFFERR